MFANGFRRWAAYRGAMVAGESYPRGFGRG